MGDELNKKDAFSRFVAVYLIVLLVILIISLVVVYLLFNYYTPPGIGANNRATSSTQSIDDQGNGNTQPDDEPASKNTQYSSEPTIVNGNKQKENNSQEDNRDSAQSGASGNPGYSQVNNNQDNNNQDSNDRSPEIPPKEKVQTPSIKWLSMPEQKSGRGDDFITAMVIDSSNNLYAFGTTDGDLSLTGGRRIKNDGAIDYFALKYSSTGRAAFLAEPPFDSGDKEDIINDIAFDSAGNMYIVGYTESNLDFGTDLELENNGDKDLFGIAYDRSGSVKFVMNSDNAGSRYDVAEHVLVDGSGNVYIGGQTYDDLDFDNRVKHKHNDDLDFFIVRYNSEGIAQWSLKYKEGNQDEHLSLMELDSLGNLYIAGYTDGDIDFGNSLKLTNDGKFDLFLLKITKEGEPEWLATTSYGVKDEIPVDLVVDSSGDVYLAGHAESSLKFGNSLELKPGDYRDLFVVKYDVTGTPQFLISSERYGGGDDVPIALEVADNGDIYLLGESNGNLDFGNNVIHTSNGDDDFFVVKFNSQGTSQMLISPREGSANNDDTGVDLEVDSSGNIYVAGHSKSDIDFGENVFLDNKGGNDFFVVRYDKYGRADYVLTSLQQQTNRDDHVVDLIVDGSSIYVAGNTIGDIDFGSDYVLSNDGKTDYFIAKYS